MEKFVNNVFSEELFTLNYVSERNSNIKWSGVKRKTQTISFLEELLKRQSGATMRLLKLIIRKADLVYRNQSDAGLEPDFRVTLCMEAAKYFDKDDKSGQKYFDDFANRNVITRGNIFSAFLFAMLTDQEYIYRETHNSSGQEKKVLYESPSDFKFIDRINNDVDAYPSTPWQYDSFGENTKFGITGFYKHY